MFNERVLDLLMVEVEGLVEKLLAEYTRMWVGDRDGNIYGQEGRQPDRPGEEVRGIGQFPAGGQSGR